MRAAPHARARDIAHTTAGDLAESIASSDPRGLYTTQALQQHRRRALSTTGMNAMLTQAKSAPGMVLNAARLDADAYALCTPDGIVDLRTGLLKTPDPNKDFHSRSTSVGPRPSPTPPPAGTASSPTPSATTPKAPR